MLNAETSRNRQVTDSAKRLLSGTICHYPYLFAVLVEMLVKYLIKALIPQLQQGQGREWRQGLPYSRYAAATLAADAKRTAPNTSGLAP